ncbi:protein I'm not dead yet-like [Drosophila kikkawai]|uniref:Protein I'm not dead yet-like n=1 Tax=Drosophila kikkawai TaxID=30033 RepID=A0A6P4IBB6_DROKI|nr:protein I'm not dead yet-like [Drosophila kikkawai]
MGERVEDYKPGDVPLEETEDRRLFCKFHYKGVLTLLLPIALAPILLGQPVMACRFIYMTVCLYLFFILNLMSRGAVAFAYVVLAPIAGITDSAKVCTAYYTDLILLIYGCSFMAIMVQVSRLHEHLAFIVIRFVGSNIKTLQLFLVAVVFFLAFFANPTASAAFGIKVAQAVMVEYSNSGILKMYSEEKRFEPGSAEYPTFPVIGIYLSLCYTATLAGAVSPFVNPNGSLVDAFAEKLKIEHVMLIMAGPVFLCLCVTILWIQIVFLGLLGGSVKRQLNELAANQNGFEQAIKDRKEALGPWNIYCKLSLAMILLTFIVMHTRKPRIYPGWDDISPDIWSGLSVQSLGLIIFFTAIPANYMFCRYYACRQPESPGTAPSLLPWKAINKFTPWGDILLLGASVCCVFCAKESGLYKAIADAISEPKPGGFLQFLYGACYGTLFTILSPATTLCKIALPVMTSAGNNFALPFATALHNQFLLPTSAPANTIVAGFGNVRPFLFLLAGIVPTIFMMIMITAFTWIFFDSALPQND